jgi:hypothetical protein
MSTDPISTRVKRKDNSKKLTKVLSTKLSNEDYDRFETYTNFAYKAGTTRGTSKFLLHYYYLPLNELGMWDSVLSTN